MTRRGRPPKARLEGGTSPTPYARYSPPPVSEVVAELMVETKKPSGYVHMLSECVDEFKERFPDDWEALKLCPLQHGIDTMVEKLKT